MPSTTLDSLLAQTGLTVGQVAAMDRDKVKEQAYRYGFSASDVDSYLGSGGSSSGGSTVKLSSSSASGGNVIPGFGGKSQWEVLQESAMVPFRAGTSGFSIVSDEDAENPGRFAAPLLSGLSSSIERLSAANASMLKGEIPADVAASVRRAASESAISGGIFGDAARGLSARDLGRKSLDVMKQGHEQESAINNARLELGKTYESIKKTNLSRNQELATLDINVASTNREAVSLERQRIATNITANVQTLQLLGDLVSKQQLYMIEAAKEGLDASSIRDTIDSWLEEISGLMA